MQNVLMDRQFGKIKPEMTMVNINISAAREHVGEIGKIPPNSKRKMSLRIIGNETRREWSLHVST